jgi:hypothetical protein
MITLEEAFKIKNKKNNNYNHFPTTRSVPMKKSTIPKAFGIVDFLRASKWFLLTITNSKKKHETPTQK